MQSPSLAEAPSPAQLQLLAELDRAFEGDPGARIFVQAALRAAHLSALPREPAPLLAFVRGHLLDAVAGELGPRAVAALLARLTAAFEGLSSAGPYESGVQPIDELDELPSIEIDLSLPSTLPPSARVAARLRVAIVHGDRFGRVSLARHLLQSACDVVVLDSFAELAALDGEFPTVAVVHLGAPEVELLLAGLLARSPGLRVLALGVEDDPALAERLLARAGAASFELAPAGVRAVEIAALVRRIAS